MPRPQENEYGSFYHNYIMQIDANTVAETVSKYSPEITEFFKNIPASKADYSYATGKWTIKDLLQHLIDAERIFTYRITRFARKDSQELLGYDENLYADNSDAKSRNYDDLLVEFFALRTSTDLMLLNLNEEQLQQSGTCNKYYTTVNAMGFIIIGHLLHHKKIIAEKYL